MKLAILLRTGNSLRRALVVRLVIALTSIGILGAAAAYELVDRYANLAYDRALADDIATLASQLHVQGGAVHLDLPPVAREWLLANEGERVLYRVIDLRSGAVLESNGDLGSWRPDRQHTESTRFRTVRLGDTDFRLGSLEHRLAQSDISVLVQIGETLGQRRRIAGDILLGSLLVFGLMIGAAVALVWTGTRAALQPLGLLEAQAAQRSSTDLRPLDPLLAPVEVRGLIEAINRLMSRLSQSMRSQSHFIANAAHQLRTPLAGLRLQAQLGLDEATDAPVRQRLGEIDRSAGRAVHLVEQLLTLARAESGGTLLLGRPVDLVLIAHDVIERHLALARERNVDLGYQGDTPDAIVTGNAVLLRELLTNLVDNAIRYGGPGGVVTIGVGVETGSVSVQVADDGEGLPRTVAPDPYARFNRSDDVSTSGAGLGLAIVKEIAEQHGAQVLHRQNLPHGTVIVVVFPPARA